MEQFLGSLVGMVASLSRERGHGLVRKTARSIFTGRGTVPYVSGRAPMSSALFELRIEPYVMVSKRGEY